MPDLLALPILFALGLLAWGLFALIRAPVPAILGPLIVIGGLRIAQVPVPAAPELLDPLVQVLLGIFIGSKVTPDTVHDIKNLFRPALVVSVWALALVFVYGPFLSAVTWLDPVTAVLSSSVGGLPEMMVLSVETSADVAVVVLMKIVRALVIITAFPFIFQWYIRKQSRADQGLLGGAADGTGTPGGAAAVASRAPQQPIEARGADTSSPAGDRNDSDPALDDDASWSRSERLNFERFVRVSREAFAFLTTRPHEFLLTFALAAAGAFVLVTLGVPAGLMVGGMLGVAIASAYGLPVRGFPPRLFNLLLVALGIMVSQHFTPETGEMLAAGGVIWPLVLSTIVVFVTGLLSAWVIHRFAGWDLPLCLLAGAPGGFTIMTSLAVYYGYDPFRVSMVHLARLLSIKTVVPLVFTFLV